MNDDGLSPPRVVLWRRTRIVDGVGLVELSCGHFAPLPAFAEREGEAARVLCNACEKASIAARATAQRS